MRHSQEQRKVRRPWSALCLLIVMPAACAHQNQGPEEEVLDLCRVSLFKWRNLESFLAQHGIKSVAPTGSMGLMDVLVYGRDAAFRARDIVRLNTEKQRWGVCWVAEALIHPGDPNWTSSWAPPESLRVADVDFLLTNTQDVLAKLEGQGIETEVYFGDKQDCVFVQRTQVTAALEYLRKSPLPGVTIRPPMGFKH